MVGQADVFVTFLFSYYDNYRSHLRTVFETDGVSRQRVEYRWSDPKIVNFKEHQNLAAELDCDKSEKSRVS